MNYTLSDQDIRIFLREAPTTGPFFRRVFTYAAGFIAIALILAAGLTIFAPNPVNSSAPILAPAGQSTPVADATPTPSAAPTPTPTATPLPVTIPNDTFSAADVKISAPIIWNVESTEKAMNKALERGVIHLSGTPVPGQQGMSAIAGHSSNYAWAKGDFNSIFAPLTKTKVGQTLEVNYQGVMYRYEVTRVYEVKPTNTAILADHSKTGIRLITCTPVGTSLRRFIVEAEQVFPDPALAAPFNGSSLNGTLPSGR
ncbi:MAG TPA: sortase [Verrucomicrobiae bacterium]|nr:sortase [Verrucomicrobiae bacterium]